MQSTIVYNQPCCPFFLGFSRFLGRRYRRSHCKDQRRSCLIFPPPRMARRSMKHLQGTSCPCLTFQSGRVLMSACGEVVLLAQPHPVTIQVDFPAAQTRKCRHDGGGLCQTCAPNCAWHSFDVLQALLLEHRIVLHSTCWGL